MDKILFPHELVKLSKRLSFHCTCCGNCCRNVKNAIMLESLDIFRMAKYFRKVGNSIQSIEEILTNYADILPLTELGYPIFTLKTTGTEQACIFLKDSRCSIEPVKSRTCRMYPFSAGPGENGRAFSYYRCTGNSHHFTGGQISVNDWIHKYFSKEDRKFVQAEFDFAPKLGRQMRLLQSKGIGKLLTPILYYRYFNYDLNEPFLPQYYHNNENLLWLLKQFMNTESKE